MGAETILTQLRDVQARETVSTPETVAGETRFVIELGRANAIDQVRAALLDLLQLRFTLEPLFGDGDRALEHDVRTRILLLRIAGLDAEVLDGSPFDLARLIADEVPDVVTAEPDLEEEFFNAHESAIVGGCWADDADEPQDRGWALRSLRVPEAWAFSESEGRPTGGEGILIGQPDTGVADHLELANALRIDLSYDFVSDRAGAEDPLYASEPWDNPGHGTATASVVISRGTVESSTPGTVSGTGGPGVVTGTAPKAHVVPIRAIKTVLRVRQSSVAQAIDHARRAGCHVVTMSLGGLPSIGLWYAIRAAVAENMIVLAAAGNCVRVVVWPARYDDCIAVGGINIQDVPWRGSCRGTSVDFSAPAEFVWRATRPKPDAPPDGTGGGQGTSFAVAVTAGVAALWLAHHGRTSLIATLGPNETLQDRFRALAKSSARRPRMWDPNNFGAGIVDAEALLRRGLGAPVATEALVAGAAPPSMAAFASALLREAAPDAALESVAAGEPSLPEDQLERHGLEICYLALRRRQADIKVTGTLEEAVAPAASPPPVASDGLRTAARATANPFLKALVE